MKFFIQKSGCGCSSASQADSCGCSATLEATDSCPNCSKYGIAVSDVTIKSQLKKEYLETLADRSGFSFCKNPQCDTVYYKDKLSFSQSCVRNKVTVKNDDPQTPLCYCQKLLKKDFFEMIEAGEENIPAKLREIIARGKSFCEKSNPKGVCCTDDVKAFIESHGLTWGECRPAGRTNKLFSVTAKPFYAYRSKI